jgi:hypothetical protein
MNVCVARSELIVPMYQVVAIVFAENVLNAVWRSEARSKYAYTSTGRKCVLTTKTLSAGSRDLPFFCFLLRILDRRSRSSAISALVATRHV